MRAIAPRAHFTDLDGMRGVLSVVVMLLHLGLTPAVAWLSFGFLPARDYAWSVSVDVFFLLSGFVLFLSLDRTRPTMRDYFRRRVRRLAPVYLLGTLAMLAMTSVPASLVIANLLMVQTFLHRGSIDMPAWSIPPELFLPALAVPFLAQIGRMSRRSVVLALSGVLLLSAAMAVAVTLRTDERIARGVLGLAGGMLLARLWQYAPDAAPRPRLALGSFAGALVAMALAARFAWIAAMIPLFAAGAIAFGTRTRTILSSAPLQALGRWSYAIYLLHIPVLALSVLVLGSADHSLWRKGVVVLATLAASACTWRFIEAPLMRPGPAY